MSMGNLLVYLTQVGVAHFTQNMSISTVQAHTETPDAIMLQQY